MRKIIKVLSLIMALLVLTGTALGCKKDADGEKETTDANTPSGESVEGKIAIVKDGVAQYSIVLPDSPSKRVEKSVDRLISTVKSTTGVDLEKKYASDSKSDKNEILIGDTGTKAGESVKKEITEKEWVIKSEGNKIFVFGFTDGLTVEAMDVLIDEIIPKNTIKGADGKYSVYFEERYNVNENKGVLTVNGKELKDYKIIYASNPRNLSKYAYKLRDCILEKYGYGLEVYSEKDVEESEYEILLGRTNRAESEEKYKNGGVRLMTRRMTVDGTKLLMLFGGTASLNDLILDFDTTYLKKITNDLKDGTYLEKNLLKLDSQEMSEGTDIRVMTSNILADRWLNGNRPKAIERAEMYAALLATYKPDIVGVQESDAPWSVHLPYYLEVLKEDYGLDYTWILHENGNLANLTSIIYRADKYQLLESDTIEYSYVKHTLYKLRMMSYGVFKDKATGKVIVHVNTHWGMAAETDNHRIEIKEEKALLDKLTAKYKDCYVFCTGDFNMHHNVGFEEFKAATGYRDSKEVAKLNGTLVNEVLGIPSNDTGGYYIDHVFISGKTDVLRYETVTVNWTDIMSDHLPQYGDFKLN